MYPGLKSLWFLCLMGICAAPESFAGQNDKISPSVQTAVAKDGHALVILETVVSGDPTQQGVAHAQRRAQTSIQGKGWRLDRQFSTVPLLSGRVEAAALDRLTASPWVARIAADQRVSGALTESAPLIGADTVVDQMEFTGQGVIIGLVDSGIDLTHPDLEGAVVEGVYFLHDNQDQPTTGTAVQDDFGHGTFMAGILTGDGVVAPRGLAPDAGLVIVRALRSYDNLGSKFLSGYISDVVAGVDWIVANRSRFPELKFINLSLFTSSLPTTWCPCDDLEDQAALKLVIARALAEDIHCIAPAGNDGPDGLDMRAPACLDSVLSVGATYDAAFLRAPPSDSFSYYGMTADCADEDTAPYDPACFGCRGACLDILAPGYRIASCGLGGGILESFGTSASAAHITGVLALMQSGAPHRSGDNLLDLLTQTALAFQIDDPSAPDFETTYLHVDALAAVGAAAGAASGPWTVYDEIF